MTNYVDIAGDTLEGKFDLKLDAEFFGQLRTTTFTQGEAPYKDLQKMRRLYQVFIIDLRTDAISVYVMVATSERSAELRTIAIAGIIDEIDNYQIVVRALASVEDRIANK